MEILVHLMNVMFIFFLFTSLINLLQKGNSPKNKSELQQDVPKETEPIEMVKDKVCHTLLQKDKAYMLCKNDQVQYFCSWKCRQKYLTESDN